MDSDAEVGEISYTLPAGTDKAITARLIVRRVKDRNHLDEMYPVWRLWPNGHNRHYAPALVTRGCTA